MKRFIVPLLGLLVLGVLIVQMKTMNANAMGQFGSTRLPKGTSMTGGATAQSGIAAEGRFITYPNAQVTVGTDFAGTVLRLPVEEKSHVEKGQVIAEIRADDVRAAMAQSSARVGEAQADIQLFDVEVTRAQRLFDEKVGTKQTLDHALRDRDAARARLETAQADVRRLEAQLAKSVIIAPISGEVTQKFVQQGESVKEQAQLLTITDLSRVRVEAEVDEFDSSRLKIGAPVMVRAEGYDGKQWRGRVEEIPDTVTGRRLKPEDPGKPTDTRVLLVKVALLEKTPLKIGQRVEVEIGRK